MSKEVWRMSSLAGLHAGNMRTKPSTRFLAAHMVRKLWSSSNQCCTASSDSLTYTLTALL